MEISSTLSRASAHLLERAASDAEDIGRKCTSAIDLQPSEMVLIDAQKTDIAEGIGELRHHMHEVFSNKEIQTWMHGRDHVVLEDTVQKFPNSVRQFDKPDELSSEYPKVLTTVRSNARLCALLLQATRWSVRHSHSAQSHPIEHPLYIDDPRKRVHIRWMIYKDLPSVLEMDEEGFEDPWLEKDYKQNLRARHCIGMVAEANDRVVGSMVYELRKHVIPILRFVVKREERQQGVGSQMVHFLRRKLSAYTKQRLLIELPEERDRSGMNFASHQRFLAVALMRERIAGMQDSFLFEHPFLPLNPSAQYPESGMSDSIRDKRRI